VSPPNEVRPPGGGPGGATKQADEAKANNTPVAPLTGRDAWLVVVNEPGRRGTWHVLRTREKTALATANRHRNRGCDVRVYRARLTVLGEVAP